MTRTKINRIKVITFCFVWRNVARCEQIIYQNIRYVKNTKHRYKLFTYTSKYRKNTLISNNMREKHKRNTKFVTHLHTINGKVGDVMLMIFVSFVVM